MSTDNDHENDVTPEAGALRYVLRPPLSAEVLQRWRWSYENKNWDWYDVPVMEDSQS